MKRAVMYGGGNIGRGFIGAVLEQAGYHVVFADVNAAVIDKINEDHCYTVHVMDVECVEQKITNISGVNSTTDAVIEQIVEAQIITTAVGVVILPRIAPAIAKGIAARRAAGVEAPLNIIACENAVRASSQLKEHVLALLEGEDKAYKHALETMADLLGDSLCINIDFAAIMDLKGFKNIMFTIS